MREDEVLLNKSPLQYQYMKWCLQTAKSTKVASSP